MTELEEIIQSSPRLSPRTKRNYTRAVRRFVAFAGAGEANWTGIATEHWRNQLLAQGLKPQTVNLYLSGLRYASRRRAERRQNPLLDFARYAETLRPEEPKPRRALTLIEGHRFISACEGDAPRDLRDTAIAVLGFRTGLRRAGICGIRFEDIKGGTVDVTLKGGKRHTIPIDDETGPALNDWMRWLRKQGIKSGPVFRSLPRGDNGVGGGLTTDGLYKAMKRRAKRAGIAGFHPHIFRHTCISWLRQQGVKGWRIAQLTGHRHDGVSDPAMIDHYTTDLDGTPVSDSIPSLRGGS